VDVDGIGLSLCGVGPALRKRREHGLSPRELAIAEDVATGAALKVIASRYHLSIQAVSTYLKRAQRKLGVTLRSDLVRAMLTPPFGALTCRIAMAEPVASDRLFTALTLTESKILTSILRGLKNAKIAQIHRVSMSTVSAHASAIMRKIGVHSRSELLARLLGGENDASTVEHIFVATIASDRAGPA
jgi:DNA-binding NarL/FixJ family response regulator